MNISALAPSLATAFSFAILTGCSMSPPALRSEGFNADLIRADERRWPNPLGHGTLTTVSRAARSNKQYGQHSFMLSQAKSQPLLYISDAGTNDVYVYSLPSGKRVGMLGGFDEPQGECSNGAGDVFVTNTQKSEILEYAHGGTKPIARLKDHGFYPVGCSIDPTTGNLAATNIFATDGRYGSVAIYKGASGSPTRFTDSNIYYYYFCGYDNRGNLYVDGYTPDNAFAFAELASGSSTFLNVALDQTIYVPGMVQWDGKYVTIGDQEYDERSASILYEFTIRGSAGFLEDMTPLTGARDVVQAWIDGHTAYAPDSQKTDVGFYHYRSGGAPYKTLAGLFTPIGSTVSQ
jgi:hypothetical protein